VSVDRVGREPSPIIYIVVTGLPLGIY
jgi:hypothetical protein